MSADLLPAILQHYQAELDDTRRALAQDPHNELLDEYAHEMQTAIADWDAIINRTASTMAFRRRWRSAWNRHNASYNDLTEPGMSIHAMASNELAALKAIDANPPPFHG